MKLRHTLTLAGATALSLAVGCGDDSSSEEGTTGGDGGMTMTTSDGGGSDGEMPMSNTIADIALADPNFSTLVAAAVKVDAEIPDAGLVAALSGDGPLTVFAPTNAAFDTLFTELGVGGVEDIPAETLATFLLNHVIGADVPSSAIPSDPPIADNLAELTLIFGSTSEGAGVTVNEATVTMADIEADNGVIHVVDDVINPASILDMAGYAGLTELATAIGAAADIDADTSVADALAGPGPFTVFAPTNQAFTDLADAVGAIPAEPLRDTLLYHVLDGAVASGDIASGVSVVPTIATPDYTDGDTTAPDLMTLIVNKTSNVKVNAATVAIADVKVTNGVIHVVDAVITRPTVVDMAGYAGLTSLAGALSDDSLPADLAQVLSGAGPFTVFAPINDAFADLPAVPTGNALDNVLKYHVTSGDLMSDELTDGVMPTMLNQDTLTINISGGSVTVDAAMSDAMVAIADVVAANGVVHVVDTVLLP